jgi:hypothetical protein
MDFPAAPGRGRRPGRNKKEKAREGCPEPHPNWMQYTGFTNRLSMFLSLAVTYPTGWTGPEQPRGIDYE